MTEWTPPVGDVIHADAQGGPVRTRVKLVDQRLGRITFAVTGAICDADGWVVDGHIEEVGERVIVQAGSAVDVAAEIAAARARACDRVSAARAQLAQVAALAAEIAKD